MKTLCLSAMLVSAAGCAVETDSTVAGVRLRRIDDQHLAAQRLNGPEAIFSATGEISVAGKNLTLAPAQKDLAIRYFTNANAVRDDGFATGMAGARTAMTAISSVFSGLANGEPDKIGPAVDAKAAKIQVQVDKLCRDLRELAATQDALAASLPEFKPYALIGTKDKDDCHSS
jgi:hypothetical protein